MRRFLASVAALALALGSTATVTAAQPSSETIYLDDHFVDTELCADFDVMTDVTGHIRTAQVVGGETGRTLLGISPTGEVPVISERGKRAGDRNAAICALLDA